jgi:hypothetical protein
MGIQQGRPSNDSTSLNTRTCNRSGKDRQTGIGETNMHLNDILTGKQRWICLDCVEYALVVGYTLPDAEITTNVDHLLKCSICG